ncbi:hypothetical protein BDK51DRAFT_28597 [Blyttiomyces helicus]|uniref:Uncharacterized protein n=1 Tax=Blyttiomyces helicus TaxID=388810 RepID=A0A4P9WI16_9FUNG|nr:hypothetical protein BDK51DRAFT_28597 [Blyttiomyces helicus]|eukprot:RKO92394.1 hypothetical protein BDK51DRAFT_28597 [Blyttiomyces helicus]
MEESYRSSNLASALRSPHRVDDSTSYLATEINGAGGSSPFLRGGDTGEEQKHPRKIKQMKHIKRGGCRSKEDSESINALERTRAFQTPSSALELQGSRSIVPMVKGLFRQEREARPQAHNQWIYNTPPWPQLHQGTSLKPSPAKTRCKNRGGQSAARLKVSS